MYHQIVLEQYQWVKVWAEKIVVTRSQLQCSSCHVYVNEEDWQCSHCGALFTSQVVEGIEE